MSALGLFTLAALAAVGVAISAAPLGCFVVWRRLAYFGDATAHAGVLGVAGALAFELPILIGAAIAAGVMSLAVSTLSGRGLAEDTLLGVMAHGALAVGLVAISVLPGVRVDLEALLLGDVLAVDIADVATIWGVAAVVVGLMARNWSALLLSTLDADMAAASGLNPRRSVLILNLALALVVAIAIKIVGVLLVAALMIVPAATARFLSSTPEEMVVRAAICGTSATLAGLGFSFMFDTPSGPTIVATTVFLFAMMTIYAALRDR